MLNKFMKLADGLFSSFFISLKTVTLMKLSIVLYNSFMKMSICMDRPVYTVMYNCNTFTFQIQRPILNIHS